MTPLRRQMLEDMQLRNLSQSTIETYLELVERFARYFKTSPQQLGAENVRAYLLHLIREKKAASTVIQIRSALRFLYVCTLKQKWFDDEIPHPKKRVTLPGVITVEEVARMLDVIQNLKHWTILATFYATAVRCKELQQLKVGDIDSQRMVLHVRQGKGGTPRDIALSPALLERLRIYFRRCRPQDWLFPSGRNPALPLNVRSIRHVFRKAARLAGIKHRVHPHLFRHASAYYTTFQSSFILKAIALDQAQSTAVYGRHARLALVPAQPAILDLCDRLPTAHTVRLALPEGPAPG
jgi:integrase/recombinase XerD